MNIKIMDYEIKGILDKFKNIKSSLLIKTVDNSTVSFIAGDIDLSMEHDVKCEVYESGVVEIPQDLVEILSTIKDYIIIKDELISYDGGQIKYKSCFIVPNPIVNFNNRIYSIKECELLKSLNNVKYAIAKDETRPILTGVNFKDDTVVAMDGFRLSVDKVNGNVTKPITIPKKLVTALTKILNKRSDNIIIFNLDTTERYI